MQVTRLNEATPYEAPKHFGMRGLRLQGWNVSPSEAFWVGLSQFLPGGGAESDSTPLEKVYVVLEGTVTVITDDKECQLDALDSCHLVAGERRAIENRTNRTAYMLVVMPYPEKN